MDDLQQKSLGWLLVLLTVFGTFFLLTDILGEMSKEEEFFLILLFPFLLFTLIEKFLLVSTLLVFGIFWGRKIGTLSAFAIAAVWQFFLVLGNNRNSLVFGLEKPSQELLTGSYWFFAGSLWITALAGLYLLVLGWKADELALDAEASWEDEA